MVTFLVEVVTFLDCCGFVFDKVVLLEKGAFCLSACLLLSERNLLRPSRVGIRVSSYV